MWEPEETRFIGMITITDFIQILLETYNDITTTLNDRLDGMTVGEWASDEISFGSKYFEGCVVGDGVRLVQKTKEKVVNAFWSQ